ncbi:Mutant cadherin [Operophtera brumata]|uniref:Mutant cadherin n=1 Tax=Operophtera brumata TaxID=104452 RepID=A0A0L7K479_OPEBR|nr:Mutant cadherin [Operophtera brumata]
MAIASMASLSPPPLPSVIEPTPTRPCSERSRDESASSTASATARDIVSTPECARPLVSHLGSFCAAAAAAAASVTAVTESAPLQGSNAGPALLCGSQCKDVTSLNLKTNGKEIKELSSDNKLSFAEIGRARGLWHVPERDDEWKLVQRRRLRNKFTTSKGKAILEQNSKFKAADTKIPLFITNVHKDVSEADIAEYILAKTRETVSPIKMKMAKERNYNAYKFFVSKHNVQTFLDVRFWPRGISFRRFVNLPNEYRSHVPVEERPSHSTHNG